MLDWADAQGRATDVGLRCRSCAVGRWWGARRDECIKHLGSLVKRREGVGAGVVRVWRGAAGVARCGCGICVARCPS